MSRKFKGLLTVSALLLFSAVSVTSLASCGNEVVEPGPDDVVTDVVTELSIANKDDLTAEFRMGDQNRLIELNVKSNNNTPAITLINNGTIKITSSDTKVISVVGSYISAVGTGTATITVSSGDLSDSFTVTVLEAEFANMMSIEEVYKQENDTNVSVTVEIVGIADGGYMLGDETGYIYYFGSAPVNLEIGKTYKIRGQVASYNGIKQLSSPDAPLFQEQTTSLNLPDVTYNEIGGEELNNLIAADADKTELTKTINSTFYPVKMTLTLDHIQGEDAFYFIDEETDDNTGVYAGYIDSKLYKLDDMKVNTRWVITGFLSGTINRDGYSNRVSLYPTSLTKTNSIIPTELTIETNKTTIGINGGANLDYTLTPRGSAGTIEYTITEGADFATISGSVLTGRAPGTVKVTAKDTVSGLESKNTLTITVTDELEAPSTIADILKNVDSGKPAYFYGKVTEEISGYGLMVEDGSSSILLYKATLPENVKIGDYVIVNGTMDDYNGKQIESGTAKITKAEADELPAVPQDPVSLTEETLPSATQQADVMRKIEIEGKVTTEPKMSSGAYDFTFEYGEGKNITGHIQDKYSPKELAGLFPQIKINYTLKVTARLCYFNGNAQFNYVTALEVRDEDGNLVEAGESYTEPKAEATTIAEVLSLTEDEIDERNNKRPQPVYTITGEVSKWYSGSDGGDFGNFYIKDADGKELVVYGASFDATALAFTEASGTWAFNNPKKWKTEAAEHNFAIGDTVTLKVLLDFYKNPQVKGVITNHVKGEGGSEDNPSGPSETPDENGNYTYDYTFTGSEISNIEGGEATLEGRKWTYDASTHFGNASSPYSGLQIGKNKAVQLTPWKISTELPENAKITSYSVTVNCGTAGHYEFSFGDHVKSGDYTKVDGGTKVTEADLSVAAETFTISLNALTEKAVYLQEVSFTYVIAE